ncbi:hypothetical protein MYCOZU1_03850 [Mycobacterium intracellulare subsp. chimaera]|nr:hypothetical protein MYCOZU1_03850 [Mycobacterium intracellulare subsp. chimaera]
MSTPRTWLGISNREWLINSNTRQAHARTAQNRTGSPTAQ